MAKSREGKNPGGRPRKYATPEDMQAAVDAYFKSTDHPTMCGLALHLGFAQRKSLWDYEGYDDGGYCNVIKMARHRVEAAYEEALFAGNPAGPIFALKNMGWSDRQAIEHSGEVQLLAPVIQ